MYQSFYTYLKHLAPEIKLNPKSIEPFLKSQKLSKGEFVFHQGGICKSVYFTLQGCLRDFCGQRC